MNMKINEIGRSEIISLYKPLADSHKGDNGVLLIIGGSKKYHGAPILAAKTASRIVDLIYFSSVPENNALIKKMKSRLSEFITVSRKELAAAAKKSDAVLIGPGMGVSRETKTFVNNLLKNLGTKKFVLDADALRVVDKKLLGKNCIVTPHKGEFKILFGIEAIAKNVLAAAKKYKCVVVLKGKTDYVSDGKEIKMNNTGNAGMTKGGTGDVLAGLIAALSCKNDLFLAASAGVYINGLAGDRLKRKISYYYNASDLADEIPKVLAHWGCYRCISSSAGL